MKKRLILFSVLLSILTFAQFGPKVKFSPENKIKYERLKEQLDSDFKVVNQKIKEQKERLKLQDGSMNYVNYQPLKDSLCNAYLHNVSKLVSPDQSQYFWKVVNRRMNKNK